MVRTLDLVARGYTRYISGSVHADKAEAVAKKFHALYQIGYTSAQRLNNKRKEHANTALVMYWPEAADRLEWMLLVSHGKGLITERERLRDVTDKPRPMWLGYELVRYPSRGRLSWTWRRPKDFMDDWYSVVLDQCRGHRYDLVRRALESLASQPGFHGVREQTRRLVAFAVNHGYKGEIPYLYYVRKCSHGEPLKFD